MTLYTLYTPPHPLLWHTGTHVELAPLFAMLAECTRLRTLRMHETHNLAVVPFGSASVEDWLRLPPQDALLMPSLEELDLRNTQYSD
jgi:hypothetical protein